LEYFLKNSDTSVILCSKDTQESAEKIAKVCGAEILPIVPTVSPVTNPGALREAILPLAPLADDKALILYTSGTTGQPKGVLWKHDALTGQVEAMLDSWAWSPDDTLLHVLPLYHLHGLINCLLTPLSCGAAVWMDPEFSAAEVFFAFFMNFLPSRGQWRLLSFLLFTKTLIKPFLNFRKKSRRKSVWMES
jgi:malonyl-CoA/methylmalonyl-CoA synthetase